jgi:hypothetical protein
VRVKVTKVDVEQARVDLQIVDTQSTSSPVAKKAGKKVGKQSGKNVNKKAGKKSGQTAGRKKTAAKSKAPRRKR